MTAPRSRLDPVEHSGYEEAAHARRSITTTEPRPPPEHGGCERAGFLSRAPASTGSRPGVTAGLGASGARYTYPPTGYSARTACNRSPTARTAAGPGPVA